MSNFKAQIPKTTKNGFRRYFISDSGNALVLAVIVAVILMTVLLIGVSLVRQQADLVSGSRRKSEALSVAEAGLDAAVWRLERQQSLVSPTTITGATTQGTYSVIVERPNAANTYHYQVTSSGTQTGSGKQKKIRQDLYYINLSRSIFSFSGTNGGAQLEGNLNIKGPFYTSGNITLSGNVSVFNLANSTGNPFMVRGDLTLGSNSVKVGNNISEIGEGSPMAVFIKGNIIEGNPQGDQVYNVVSKQVPEVTLPEVVSSEFLDAARANNNSVYIGNLELNNTNQQFGSFNYVSNSPQLGTLTVDGVVYVDGNLTINKNIDYTHATTDPRATIFANGKITINGSVESLGSQYPVDSVLAFVNEDKDPLASVADDVNDGDIIVAAPSNNTVEAFLYSSGQISVKLKPLIHGSVMSYLLWLEQVPTLQAPPDSAQDNFPQLYPGKDLAFLTAANWREVAP